METFAPKARLPYKGYHGRGFVEITKKKNLNIKMPVAVKESGLYAISFRYANGSGPYNTDNKCAIRSLLVDKQFKGTVVMSQLAKDEWSLWSQSNSVVAELSKGKHMLELKFLPFNENMNVEVNRAMLDQMRIVKIK